MNCFVCHSLQGVALRLQATLGLCAGVALGLMYELKEVSAKRITLISKISFKLKIETS